MIDLYKLHFSTKHHRSPSCAQVHPESISSTDADWALGHVCHPNLCHNRLRILFWSPS